MGISVYLSSPAPLTGDETRVLRQAVQNLADGLPWGCEAFDIRGGNQVDGLFVAVKVHNEDADVLWRDLLQVAALGLVASRALPERLFKVDDDLDLLSSEVGRLAMRGGLAQGEGVHAALSAAIGATLDAAYFRLEAPVVVPDEDLPEHEGPCVAKLEFPSEGAGTPPGYANRPWVKRFSLVQEPADDDGDICIAGAFELINGDDAGYVAVGVKARLFDADGGLMGVFEDEEGPVGPGQRVLLQTDLWARTGVLARAEVWVFRRDRATTAVTPQVFWGAPDDDGDHPVDLHVAWQGSSTPARVTLNVTWESGETEDIALDDAGTGEQLLVFQAFSLSGTHTPGAALTATLGIEQLHSFKGPDAPSPALPSVVEAVPSEPVEPAHVDPAAGPWENVQAGNYEAAIAQLDSLDSEGRDLTRRLIDSAVAAEIVTGLRIATRCNWRSSVTMARRLLHHEDPQVREQACRTCGELGGPSLVIPLRASLKDPDPRVRRAADAAIALIEG